MTTYIVMVGPRRAEDPLPGENFITRSRKKAISFATKAHATKNWSWAHVYKVPKADEKNALILEFGLTGRTGFYDRESATKTFELCISKENQPG